jgi:hypothetical protein
VREGVGFDSGHDFKLEWMGLEWERRLIKLFLSLAAAIRRGSGTASGGEAKN